MSSFEFTILIRDAVAYLREAHTISRKLMICLSHSDTEPTPDNTETCRQARNCFMKSYRESGDILSVLGGHINGTTAAKRAKGLADWSR